jgi:uncharacterized membrane protein (UPF0182 family)
LIVFIAVLTVIGGFIAIVVKIYPDLLWFGVVGYSSVYKKILLTKLLLGVSVGGFFLIVTLLNVYLLFRLLLGNLAPQLWRASPYEERLILICGG